MSMIKVAPSILSSNFAILGEEIQRIENAKADFIHIDIMDANFVPNLTLGPVIVKAVRSYSKLPFDVHLMINNPIEYAEKFIEAGADFLTFHVESPCFSNDASNILKLLKSIKKLGCAPGLVLKPQTPAEAIFSYMEMCSIILVMTVEPGFGGQEFMPETLSKIKTIRQEINSKNYDILLEVDGGIDQKTAELCVKAGANVLVSGNYLFNHQNMSQAIAELKSIAK